MKTPITQSRLDSMRSAIEGADARALASLYADNAVMRIIDSANPPSHPRLIDGKKAIAAFYEDICGRKMTHHVEDMLVDGDRLAFTEACEYPDGSRVYCAALAEFADGRIARQTTIQAWDE